MANWKLWRWRGRTGDETARSRPLAWLRQSVRRIKDGFRDLPLRSKLAILMVGTSISALLLFFVAFTAIEISNQKGALSESHLVLSRFVANVSAAAIAFDDPLAATNSLDRLDEVASIQGVRIYDQDGGLFAERYWNVSAEEEAALKKIPPDQSQAAVFDRTLLLIRTPVILDNQIIGWVRMFSNVQSLNKSIFRLVVLGVEIAIFLMIVSTLAALIVGRRLTAPIGRLVETVNRVGDTKDFSVRVKDVGGDEIGSLGMHFNELLRRIEKRDGELATYRAGLERQIEIRTKALSERNVDLTREITERERSKGELLIAKEAAEAASKAKSEFLANMSHEIRTPMNAVIGMSDLIAQTQLSGCQERFVKSIQKAGQGLLSVINDVLDFSKLEVGGVKVVHGAMSVRGLVGEVTSVLSGLAEEKGLDVFVFIDDQVPDSVMTDEKRLRQVLTNLINNAIKFTESGEIKLEVGVSSTEGNKTDIYFSVSDTGIGIPRDQHEKIFDMFQQVDGTLSRKFGGTGLGLSISRSLVELMDGRIELRSEVGVGSTFNVTVPTIILKPHEVTTLVGLKRALIVEGVTTGRNIFTKYLISWGIDVVAVETGELAIDAIRNAETQGSGYSFILCDADAAGLAGIGIVERVRNIPSATATPIILIAGNKGSLRLSKVVGDSNCRWIGKPVSKSDLYNAILLLTGKFDDPSPEGGESRGDQLSRAYGARVLLVEDNPVNQEVAWENLTQLGCHVDVVGAGDEAVKSFEIGRYDVIFMDGQLPGMDGFAATRHIRKIEEQQRHRVPVTIIALTAHAMDGDEQRCLDAGMDDYLAKPFRLEALVRCLDRWHAKSGGRRDRKPTPATPSPDGSTARTPPDATDITPVASGVRSGPSPLDDHLVGELRTRKPEFWRRLTNAFISEAEKVRTALPLAHSEGDWEQMEFLAHAMRSAAANIGASRLSEISRGLEGSAKQREQTACSSNVREFEEQLELVIAALLDSVSEPDQLKDVV